MFVKIALVGALTLSALPAFAGSAEKAAKTHYLEDFTSKLAEKRVEYRLALQDAKRRRTFFASANSADKRLWLRAVRYSEQRSALAKSHGLD